MAECISCNFACVLIWDAHCDRRWNSKVQFVSSMSQSSYSSKFVGKHASVVGQGWNRNARPEACRLAGLPIMCGTFCFDWGFSSCIFILFPYFVYALTIWDFNEISCECDSVDITYNLWAVNSSSVLHCIVFNGILWLKKYQRLSNRMGLMQNDTCLGIEQGINMLASIERNSFLSGPVSMYTQQMMQPSLVSWQIETVFAKKNWRRWATMERRFWLICWRLRDSIDCSRIVLEYFGVCSRGWTYRRRCALGCCGEGSGGSALPCRGWIGSSSGIALCILLLSMCSSREEFCHSPCLHVHALTWEHNVYRKVCTKALALLLLQCI